MHCWYSPSVELVAWTVLTWCSPPRSCLLLSEYSLLVLVFVLVTLLNAHLVRTTEKFEDSPLAPCASPRSDWPTASLLAPSEEKTRSYLICSLQREYLTITITCCCSRALAVTSLAIRLNPLPLPFPMSMLTFTVFSDISLFFFSFIFGPESDRLHYRSRSIELGKSRFSIFTFNFISIHR